MPSIYKRLGFLILASLFILSPAIATTIHDAAEAGNIELVKQLIAKGAKVDARRGWVGPTPLYGAAFNGHADVVGLLISKGAKVDAKNQNGTTPLHAAAGMGHADVTELLINKGAEVDVMDQNGLTPLYSAAQGGHADVVELLINESAEVDAENQDGTTPLRAATDNGHTDVAELLISRGAISTKPADSNASTTQQKRVSAEKSGDYAREYALYRPRAEQGDVEAQLRLSHMYSEGLGVAKDDLKAIEWHAMAVEGGDAASRLLFYLKLANIRKDAEKGDANAQYKLGIMYNNGWGVPADFAEAIKWYRKAAEQGHAASKDMLGTTFFANDGICTNTKYKFEAKAPIGWDVNSIAPGSESIRGYCKFIKNGAHPAPVISLTIDFLHDYMLNYSLTEITKYILKSVRPIEIAEQPNEVKVNTLPASKATYGRPGVKVMLYQFRKESSIITIQLVDRSSTFESNIGDFQKTVSSFKWTSLGAVDSSGL